MLPFLRRAFLRCCSDTLPIRIRSISLCRWPKIACRLSTLTTSLLLHQCTALKAHNNFHCSTCFAHTRCCSSDFSFAKIAQASFCKGIAPALTRKFFKDFGVQLRRKPNSLKPKGLKIFRSSLAFTFLLLACSVLQRKNYKERLGAKHLSQTI